jgi:hypothetical protein
VMESLNLKVHKPIIVHIDNVGAIFVAENPSATKHTRHIDARYHFVREYIIDGVIKIIFINSKENKADIFTKNVTGDIYEEHVDDFIIHREVIKVSSKDLEKIQYFDSGGVTEKDIKSTISTNEQLKSEVLNKGVTEFHQYEKLYKYLEGTNPGSRTYIGKKIKHMKPS